MIASLLLALLVQVPGAVPGEPIPAFVEVVAPRETLWLHEPVRLRVRAGVESAFLAEQVIQPFRQRLDVPLQIDGPWLDDIPCAVPTEGPAAAAAGKGGPRIAVGDSLREVRRAPDVTRDGAAYTVYELELDVLFDCTGEIVVPGPRLRVAYATRFRDDLFHGRVPDDRRDAVVAGAPLGLVVRPLPHAGRPLSFSGAVGDLRVRADASPRALGVGESIALELVIEGPGNLALLDAPRLDLGGDFRVFGHVRERGPERVTFRYAVAPARAGALRLPPIELAYFDPEAGAYRTATTAAIEVSARQRAPAPALAPDPPPPSPSPVPGLSASGNVLALLAVVALVAIALLLAIAILLRRALRATARDAGTQRPARGAGGAENALRIRAAVASAHAVLDAGADATDVWTSFLATCLASAPAAVIGPRLPERLAAVGFSAERAAGASALLDRLVGARYGGAAVPDGVELVRAELDACERADRA